ncbi:MAG TPA: hypothetical protein PLE76_08805 [Rectinema sp.]|jgi:hypothetical protein|nr:hypothetical protein [Rectinema sp.]
MIDVFDLASLIFGIWQFIDARRAKKKQSKIESQYKNLLENLPGVLTKEIVKTIRPNEANLNDKELASADSLTSASFADLDGDGEDELIVQFPFSVHGSAIQIYRLTNGRPELCVEDISDTPSAFQIDFSDRVLGPMLVKVVQDSTYEVPYHLGLRDTIWLRFENNKLIECRRQTPSEQEVVEKFHMREQEEQEKY